MCVEELIGLPLEKRASFLEKSIICIAIIYKSFVVIK